jgi:hypothetical protein
LVDVQRFKGSKVQRFKVDNLVKSRIFPFFWIPAFAGMTIRQLISDRYHRCLAREGGYPVFKRTFYDSIKVPFSFLDCIWDAYL